MSAKTETSIWLAQRKRVAQLPYPKAWPGEKFAVPNNGVKPLPYLRIGRVSTTPTRMVIAPGKPHQRTGMLIVTLVHPLGLDVCVYDQIAATIAEYFVDGTEMYYDGVCVCVTAYPHVQEGYEDNGYWNVPVSIPWRCFA